MKLNHWHALRVGELAIRSNRKLGLSLIPYPSLTRSSSWR